MLKDKKILIGITGSIAAYKIILLVRLLTRAGAEVKIVMTPAAKDFVSPLVLSTLTNHKVLIDLFADDTWSNHVLLGRWADVFLIVPLSCNTLAKMATGQSDNLLLTTYLSATCPVWVAPAMDEDMWHHPATKRNIAQLHHDGVKVLSVTSGSLASGLVGEGRMAEPEYIFTELEIFFRKGLFAGKKVLITAGPTYEALDPVRFIGNYSSGKMGFALAEDFYLKGADVVLVTGPTYQKTNFPAIDVVHVTSAQEMLEACENVFGQTDIAVMSAAVADFAPAVVAPEKIKKKDAGLQVQLTKTTDILKTLGQKKSSQQFLVGFALETENELENAKGKLQSKNADFIVLNSLRDRGAGFGGDTNKVSIIDKNGHQYESGLQSKKDIAAFITDIIFQNISGVRSL